MEKKGFQLAISTIVILILAIVVLMFLALFFSRGAGDFIDTFKGFSGFSNVDAVASGCNSLVNSGSVYSYCCEKKKVRYFVNGEESEGEFSCLELLNESFISINKMECDLEC